MQDYDSAYIMPVYKKPWVLSIAFWLIAYATSIFVILLFIKQ